MVIKMCRQYMTKIIFSLIQLAPLNRFCLKLWVYAMGSVIISHLELEILRNT